MGKIVEGLWDCPYCGCKGIGGLKKHCPNCNHPQDEGTAFYLGTAKHYLDEETASKYGQGEDWTCSFCGSMNRYDAQECVNCGAPREENKGSYSDNRQREASQKAQEASAALAKRQAEALNRGSKKRWPILAAILVVLAAVLIFVFMPKSSTSVLESKQWSREIQIEQYTTVQEDDWQVPDGGRVYDQKEEIHHYDHVIDHYEEVQVQKSREVLDGYDTVTDYVDNGDGTFSEVVTEEPRYTTEYYYEYENQPVYVDLPVYQTKYYYDIDKWIYERSVCTEGEGDDAFWGEVTLVENEREGDRQEDYHLIFKNNKDKRYECDVNWQVYDSLRVGDTVKLTVSAGKVKKINDVEI